MGGDIERAQKLYNDFFELAAPKVREYVNKKHNECRSNNGWVNIELVNHPIYCGIPEDNASLRHSVNYCIQSLSSSLNGYMEYILYKLCRLNNLKYLPLTFTHDAWNNEVKVIDIFKFTYLTRHVFTKIPYELFNIPFDIDTELGLGFYSMGKFDFKINNNTNKIEFNYKCKYIDNNESILDKLNKYLPNFKIMENKSDEKILYDLIGVMYGNSYASIMNKSIRIDNIKCECDIIFDPKELIIPDNETLWLNNLNSNKLL